MKTLEKVRVIAKRWFIDAFSGMAQGLFCTLIAGTILQLFAKWIGVDNFVGGTLNSIGNFAKSLMGAGIGVGIAHALKTDKLTSFQQALPDLWALLPINCCTARLWRECFQP